MSVIVNNNASIANKEDHITVYDRERRISITEETSDIAGLTLLSKTISFEDDYNDDEDNEYTTCFVPTVSCDDHQDISVYGHSIY